MRLRSIIAPLIIGMLSAACSATHSSQAESLVPAAAAPRTFQTCWVN